MTEVHKRTRQRFTRARHSGDISIDLQGPEGLSQESVPVIGGWSDYTGSGGVPTKQLMFFPRGDKLWGTDAYVDGARLKDLDALGNRIGTTRLRRKKEVID